MPVRRSEELEQRGIDHEVRLSRARMAAELYALGRDSRRDRQTDLDERAWYRAEVRSILATARTPEELDGLGLSDQVVRDAGLGASLREAWMRFHLPSVHLRAPPRT